jgi:hypothetical protein
MCPVIGLLSREHNTVIPAYAGIHIQCTFLILVESESSKNRQSAQFRGSANLTLVVINRATQISGTKALTDCL